MDSKELQLWRDKAVKQVWQEGIKLYAMWPELSLIQ